MTMTKDDANRELEVEKLDLRSMDIAEERKAELLQLFPEIRTEGGKVDIERLRLALGEAVDVGKERYGLTWPGKAECFKTIQAPSLGTLRPCPEESLNFDTTENVIIEGDNLEVLKLLQKSYLGKVKMIYIDPPYNTGNDFIYPDNFAESLQTYLQYTGQVDAEGKKFGTNTDADGRFHSKWLNMMYPRIYLARNLLCEEGALLVSCDDVEVSALRMLLNDVFGEENFIAQFVWKARQFTDTRAKTNVSTDHEYVIAYSAGGAFSVRGNARDESKFSNPDQDPRGPWMSRSILGLATREQRPNLHYDITEPKTNRLFPPDPASGWRYSPDKMADLVAQGRILFPKSDSGRPREKKFRADMQSDRIAFRSVIDDIHTADGTQELRQLLGGEVMPFPKPSALLRMLAEQFLDEQDLVADFFAGSGSTAHAVLELNRIDGGSRKFMLIQLPEPTGRSDFATIADICKERVRRVIAKINEEDEQKLDLVGDTNPDRGFRVFKLAESNFKTWEADKPKDAAALESQLDHHIDHIRQGRRPNDILYELLLKSGFPLTATVETLTLLGKQVYSVSEGALLVCLERELSLELIRAIAERKPERVICLDAGFSGNDQLKANAVQIFRAKGVTKFQTV
jgi:adenine-specific DNA-methyltransferase